MKTELIFFDTYENGLEGTKRGLIAFISLIVFDLIWFSFMKKYYPVTRSNINIYSSIFVWLLLCSAIAVQIPKNMSEAILYGLLVGLVVYGIYNFTNLAILKEWNIKIAIIDTIWGIINCGIAALLIYLIYWKSINKTNQ